MGYCAVDDLRGLIEERHLVALSNDQPGAASINQVNIDAAIDQADKVIDGYAGVQRTVPLNPVPGLIRTLSANMAVFFLYRRRGQVPEIWEQQYRNDVQVLVKISTGQISFGAAALSEPPPERALTASSPKALGGSGGMLEGF